MRPTFTGNPMTWVGQEHPFFRADSCPDSELRHRSLPVEGGDGSDEGDRGEMRTPNLPLFAQLLVNALVLKNALFRGSSVMDRPPDLADSFLQGQFQHFALEVPTQPGLSGFVFEAN